MTRATVISVNSVSGGGKTTLATALHQSLPRSALYCFDEFDDSNIYPKDFYAWSRRGADVTEFDCPGMRNAVDAEIRKGSATQIILDYPFGRRHPRFADIIDLAVYIDTPLDVAMARRILRDYDVGMHKSPAEAMKRLRGDLKHYIAKARYPYLETLKDRDRSDLVLDGWGKLEEMKTEVISRLESLHR